MKVEEAKTKVCPFMSFVSVDDKGYFNCKTNCIYGDCMAWVDTTPKEVNTKRLISKIYPTPEKSGYCARIGQ